MTGRDDETDAARAKDPVPPERIDEVARRAFGLDSLRPAQRDAIRQAVSGRDVLAVWATGSGKSAVYQISAALLGGVTVVVSPLIALQEDQLVGLEEAPDAPEGVALNSARGARARREAWRRLKDGEVEYVLLAPEQLVKDDVIAELAALDVSLLVVDEAHCIASWGHDFRPDYLMVGAMAGRLGRPPIVALTATASTPVREEIVRRLGLRDPAVLVGDVDRPNITLTVRRHTDAGEKRDAVLDEVAALPRPGLLYTATRRESEEYAAALSERGLRAVAYHAGLRVSERNRVHEEFLDDVVDVVVATSAFGMGIDKENVRFVVHADAPDSVDAYYQELGRAGRDGAAASGTLHYRPEDLSLRRFFASKNPDAEELRRLVGALADGRRRRSDLAEAAGLSPRRVTGLLALLEDTAFVRLSRNGAALRRGVDHEEAVQAALARSEERERIDQSRVDMLRGYAETRRCRRQVLLGYFGQELEEPCGNCDTCTSGSAFDDAEASPTEGEYRVDQRVQHREWGDGTVTSVEDDRITVFFESQGYKVLSVDLVEENDLLRT
ncbi:RecQ family ATP-dependent DNA helicase [Microbacterium sp. Marseille-Q6965]|uniref:RecQ family ATP-dependent DNA helicase n=1 Tax=Microbacterium sp. Marseille-Q6965 TaxID=2965072 RepID=UPI0021B7B23A|nr:RecQ family ATP-dependent DNA helicase [Microbacterium sp. Marseille-Q6965]